MSEMTTREMIEEIKSRHGPAFTSLPRPFAEDVAARLKALEEMRAAVARFQEEMHDDGQCLGVPSMACLDISDRLRAILDAAREVE